MSKRLPTKGMHHLALQVKQFEASLEFYTKLVGMQVEWQPDADNVYLCSGSDNLALHRAKQDFTVGLPQRLDHLGFILSDMEQVDCWHDFLKEQGVKIKAAPRTHRDGARSFYCEDPDGNLVQFIYHPPLANVMYSLSK